MKLFCDYFFKFFFCKPNIKVKLEDSQLCADCFPCISFLFDISVGLQSVVNTVQVLLHQMNHFLIVEIGHVLSLHEAFED